MTFHLIFPVGRTSEEVADPLLHLDLGPQAQVSGGLLPYPQSTEEMSVAAW